MGPIFRLLGLFLMVFSMTMLVPWFIGYMLQESHPERFLWTFFITLSTGLILWYGYRRHQTDLKIADGFMIVVLFWVVLSVFGAIPFMILPGSWPSIRWVDALFESISGFTTTGATVLTKLDSMDWSIRYYRQQLHFLGGMGILVLVVAILPTLGIGGMQLYQAEIPGPVKDYKLTPRITQTAKALWYLYVGLTIICVLAYWLAGLSWLEAIGEGFSTIATGGFSMHQASFAFYNDLTVEVIAMVFMVLSAVSYPLHYWAVQRGQLRHYWQDEEFRLFIYAIAVCTILVYIGLLAYGAQHEWALFFHALFAVISLASTTGFVIAPFALWPTFMPMLMMCMALVGGCAGSTSGGIKLLRVLLLGKQIKQEFRRLLHPQSVFAIVLNGKILSHQVLHTVWAFIGAFMGLFILAYLLLLADGLDVTTAFGAAAASLANAGASIGLVAYDYASLSDVSKCGLMVLMLAGRLEIFSLFVLIMPMFWRR